MQLGCFKLKNIVLKASFIAIMIVVSRAALGQQNGSIDSLFSVELEQLFNIKVNSSSRILKKSASSAPSKIIIITEDQIKRRGYTSILELFEDLPGFKVDRAVDPRYMNDVTLRGLRYSDKFIILIDGVRVSSPTNEIIPILENYPVHFAQQIEVIYGSASALYGADAFSGVINIITKESDKKTDISLRAEGGQFAYALGNLFLSHRIDKNIDLSMSAQFMHDEQPDLSEFYPTDYQNADQVLQTGVFNTQFGTIRPQTRVVPLEEHPQSAYALQTRLNVGDFSLSYFGNYSRIPSTTANTPNNSVYNRASYLGQYINTVNLRYNKSWGNWTSTSYAVGSRYDLDNWSNFRNAFTQMEPAYLYSYSWKTKLEEIVNYKWNDQSSITFGATFEDFVSVPRSNDLEYPLSKQNPGIPILAGTVTDQFPEGISTEIKRIAYSNIGVYAEHDQQWNQELSSTVGVRYDYNSRFGGNLNPRIGLVYQPSTKLSIKALYGTAYLEPSPQYTFDQFGRFVYVDSLQTFIVDYAQIQNPELNPQRIQSSELVLNYLASDKLIINASSFLSYTDGLISPKIVEPGPAYTLDGFEVLNPQIYDNLGTQITYGFEINSTLKFDFQADKRIEAYLNYSYIDGMLDHDDSGDQIRNLPGISNHTVKLGASWISPNWTLNIRNIAMSNQRVINIGAVQEDNPLRYQTLAGYWVTNAFLQYKWNNIHIFSRIHNLFDQRYRNVNLGAAPQDNVMGTSILEFQNGAPQNPRRITLGLRIDI